MEISGKIYKILPEVTGQGKSGMWRKQDFVIEFGDQYPKKLALSTWGDKVNMNAFKEGDNVKASFDPESREYQGKWYTDCRVWKLEKIGGSTSESPANQQQHSATAIHDQGLDVFDGGPGTDDDLPF
jgi:hypothetical protein